MIPPFLRGTFATLLAGALLGCGSDPVAPPSPPRAQRSPPSPSSSTAATAAAFEDRAPARTRLLLRIEPGALDAAPVSALAEQLGCAPDLLEGARVDALVTEEGDVRAEIRGPHATVEALECLRSILGTSRAWRIEGLAAGGGVLVASRGAAADGPGASPDLASRYRAMQQRGSIAAVAELGALADPIHASLVVGADGLTLELVFPDAGTAERIRQFWRDASANVDPSKRLGLDAIGVDGAGNILTVHVAETGLTPPGRSAALALAVRARILESFKQPSGSMLPTLRLGDHFFVDKTQKSPRRGDVVVFEFPEDPSKQFVKRVAAVAGDTIEFVNGRPILNGRPVQQCHVGSASDTEKPRDLFVEVLDGRPYLVAYESERPAPCGQKGVCPSGLRCRAGLCGDVKGPFRLATGQVWMLGDNRDNSHDSRSFFGGRGGGVPASSVTGRVSVVYLSFDDAGKPSWERVGLDVHAPPRRLGAAALDAELARCLSQLGGSRANP